MNKEIEEFAIEIFNNTPKPAKQSWEDASDYMKQLCIDMSKALYKAGYRKIDGVKAQAQDLICKAVLNGSDGKKKAIKEFAENLKKNMKDDCIEQLCFDGAIDQSFIFSYIDNLLKEYGIDIDEVGK